jgi:hypothetical protein
MGLHLKLFVLRDAEDLTHQVSAMTVLEVNEYMPLNAALTDVVARRGEKAARWGEQQLKPQPTIRGFALSQTLHNDESYTFDVDGYGDSLTFTYAGDIANLSFTEDNGARMSHHPDAIAALAYLGALPRDTPVVLYWI